LPQSLEDETFERLRSADEENTAGILRDIRRQGRFAQPSLGCGQAHAQGEGRRRGGQRRQFQGVGQFSVIARRIVDRDAPVGAQLVHRAASG
jgi:hypothetical protein